MWCAAANCFESLGQRDEAIRCYRRADQEGDTECIALNKLAKLTSPPRGSSEVVSAVAAGYHERVLGMHNTDEGIEVQEVVDALISLARYHYKTLKQYDTARKYCQRLMDCTVPEKEEARAMLIEMENLA